MGHSLSADKRERQNQKRYLRNKQNRSVLKKQIKTFEAAAKDQNADPLAAFAAVQQALDRAARKRAIPKKRADRKKSRLAKQLAKLRKPAEPTPA